jgi:cell division protein FtsZ
MQGEIRVTVIATGFDRALQAGLAAPLAQAEAPAAAAKGAPVIPFPAQRAVRSPSSAQRVVTPETTRRPGNATPPAEKPGSQDLNDMEIPTFIRRQMD